jgi:hypothetical protein
MKGRVLPNATKNGNAIILQQEIFHSLKTIKWEKPVLFAGCRYHVVV